MKNSTTLILILIGILLFEIHGFSQKSKYQYVFLDQITYKNHQLDSIFAKAITTVKYCEYYSEDISFAIIFDTHHYLTLSLYDDVENKFNDSIYGDSVSLYLHASHYRQDIFCFPGIYSLLGYFKFQQHLFAVYSTNLDIENQKFFKKTKHKKRFIVNNSDKVKTIVKTDYIRWEYVYINNRFYLKKIYNDCLDH